MIRMWPWSTIKELRQMIQEQNRMVEQVRWREQLYRAEYLKFQRALRGANKGIWRLKQKLNRLSQEAAPHD